MIRLFKQRNGKFKAPLLIIFFFLIINFALSNARSATAGKDYYGMMGLSKECSATDVKKAYRKLALKHHPDKVASEEREKSEKKFKEIARAYEILSDEDKRKLYDQYGEAGVDPNFNPAFAGMGGQGGGPQTFHFGQGKSNKNNKNGMGGFSFDDGSESMFSGGRPGGDNGGGVNIDLSEILRGFMDGQGGGGNGMSNGGGFGTQRSSPGMGFFSGQPRPQQQQQSPAQTYSLPFYCTLEELATGCTKKLKVKNPAMDPMTGQKVMRERIYSLMVKPGWKKGTKVKFKATNDGFPPITFTLDEKKHNFYRRMHNDIVWKCNISRSQATKGVKLKVPLLDGSLLEILVQDGIPIYHQQRKIIKGKGMPIKGGPQHGDLIIEFNINVTSM